MEKFKSREFFILLENLTEWRHACEKWKTAGEPLSEATFGAIESCLKNAEQLCEDVGFTGASSHLNNINIFMYRTGIELDTDYSALSSELRNAYDAILSDYVKHKFIAIRPEFASHVNNDTLLGDRVSEAFPSAKPDISEAGNCLATKCSTAAVFHLMRVAEFGLRALARDRRVVIPKKLPLALATWEDIIKQLENAEDAIRNYPKTIAREAQYEFYHGAMMEFKRFKNKFRNVVMHNRDMYDDGEAMSAFNHVKSFMAILSSAISERKRTPVVWKRNWSATN